MDARAFFYRLGRALYRIDACYDQFAKEGQVSPTVLWVLYALNDGRPHTQREICADWALPKSTVNTAVQELRQAGHLALLPIPGKRRELTLALTESGQQYADRLLAPLYQREAAVFQAMTGEERQLVPLLEGLAERLSR